MPHIGPAPFLTVDISSQTWVVGVFFGSKFTRTLSWRNGSIILIHQTSQRFWISFLRHWLTLNTPTIVNSIIILGLMYTILSMLKYSLVSTKDFFLSCCRHLHTRDALNKHEREQQQQIKMYQNQQQNDCVLLQTVQQQCQRSYAPLQTVLRLQNLRSSFLFGVWSVERLWSGYLMAYVLMLEEVEQKTHLFRLDLNLCICFKHSCIWLTQLA